MQMMHSLRLAIGLGLVSANMAQAQTCSMADVQSSRHFRGSVPLGAQHLSYDATVRFNFRPKQGGLYKITETISADVRQLPTLFSRLINERSSDLPKDTCDMNANLRSTSVDLAAPAMVARSSIKGEQWKCVSLDAPCPSLRKPFRICRKEAKFIIGSGTAVVRIRMVPRVDRGNLKIVTSSDTQLHLDAKTKLLGGIVSGIFVGAPAMAVFVEFGDALASALVKESLQLPPPSPVPVPGAGESNPLYNPVLVAARFGALPTGVGLILVREATVRTGTACFIRDQIPR